MPDLEARLLADIYEAAVTPSVWPSALDTVARLVSAEGACLLLLREDRVLRWIASEGLRDLVSDWVEGGWQRKTERAPRMIKMRHPGFVSDLDVFTREELDRQLDQIEFLRPRGFGWGAGTYVEFPNGDVAVYSIERRLALGSFERAEIDFLDRLRPHLARAALIANRLNLERARSAVSALEAMGLAAAALDAHGIVIASNKELSCADDQIIISKNGQLTLNGPEINEIYLQNLGLIASGDYGQACSMPIRATRKSPAAVAHLIPVCGAANDVFSQAVSILILTPVAGATSPAPIIIQSLFDLSPTEARIAKAIVDGQTVQKIASQSGASPHTVRTQLKAVMGKLGVSRQAEIVALLSRLSLPT